MNDLKAVGVFHFGNPDKSGPLGSLKETLATAPDPTDTLIVLPEGFNVPGGFYPGNDPDPSVRSALLELSEAQGIAFVAGLIDDDPRYNSAYLIDAACKESIRLLSRKRQQPGQNYISDPQYESEPVLHRGFGIASLICHDLKVCDDDTRKNLIDHPAWAECGRRILCVPACSTNSRQLEPWSALWTHAVCIAAANGSMQDNSFVQGLGFETKKVHSRVSESANYCHDLNGILLSNSLPTGWHRRVEV